jgi:Myb-like DNA-binding domain
VAFLVLLTVRCSINTQEDRLLLHAILRSRKPFRWPNIADLIPNRTGKQCRERYFNHLKPTLNHSEWSPVEDALLFHLHGTVGPRWATIAGLLKGRTNNSVKNRFHHIRRRLEKDAARLDPMALANESPLKLDVLKRLSNYITPDEPESTMDVIHLLVDSFQRKKALVTMPHGFTFELVAASSDTGCSRCGLLVPSKQTGNMLCKTTGWCESCISAPAYLCSDLLRIAHTSKLDSSDPPDAGAI